MSKEVNSYIRYRIYVINQFKNVESFVDYQQWGDVMKVWGASRVHSEHKHWHEKGDGIYVFLNRAIVDYFDNKQEAINCIDSLLESSPVNLHEYRDYLIGDLC